MKGEKQKTEESGPQRNCAERERYVEAPTLMGDSWRRTRRSVTIGRQDVGIHLHSRQP